MFSMFCVTWISGTQLHDACKFSWVFLCSCYKGAGVTFVAFVVYLGRSWENFWARWTFIPLARTLLDVLCSQLGNQVIPAGHSPMVTVWRPPCRDLG